MLPFVSDALRQATSAILLLACASAAPAQVVAVPPTPQINSSNPVTAAPPVPRPHTIPCVVDLFVNEAFDNYTPYVFSYHPPSHCPEPWSKVVFTGDFTVSEGRQYDRTAAFYVGHANIFYGTTAEPRSALSPSWHVERDVTDLSYVFKSSQTGQADLGNFVGVSEGVTYNGIIYVTAKLEFYPVSEQDPAPRTPDLVVPVNGPGGDAGTLNTTADQITQALDLPRNVESVYLDVIAQSQSNDEFWYFCVPDNETANLESCGNTAFRETEISIDGQPAGVAPIYPWIYTGGIDPYLWEPIPGVQTLNFKPYRVDLTPFAGSLSDGGKHLVAVSVYNANSYFLATANLLVYTDPLSSKVSGGIISNTLSADPDPVVSEDITVNPSGSTYTGTVSVFSSRAFVIKGYVDTAHGRIETTVKQEVSFKNNQQFDVSPTLDTQNVQQTSTVHASTMTTDGFAVTTAESEFSYPLTIEYSYVAKSDGSSSQATKVSQQDFVNTSLSPDHWKPFETTLGIDEKSQDTLNFDASGNFLGASGTSSSQSYRAADSLGFCYSRTIEAEALKLTSVEDGNGCPGGH